MRPLKVWDLPVRLFHWAIVLLIVAAWLSQELDQMELHMWIGRTILSLLLFRILWGFIGSDTARFGKFLRNPALALRHLRYLRRREPDEEIGHNAAGGWMVLLMLLLLGVQAATGLFSNDDGNTEGPLMHLVGKDRSDALSHIHSLNFTLIEGAIVVHVLAIAAYALLKRQDLVRPMISGKKMLPPDAMAPRLASLRLALVTLVVAVAVVIWVTRL
jgi:cytochrome b